MFCKNCGKELPEGAVFCGGCGCSCNGETPLEPEKKPAPKKPKGNGKIVALIIALVILVVGGTAYGLYGSGVFDDLFQAENTEEKTEEESKEEKDNIEENDTEETDKAEEEKDTEAKKESSKVEADIIPQIRECTAISTLESDGENTYSAKNLIDGNPQTAWVEGDSDDGVGNCVHVYLKERAKVSKVSILNGYCKDEERYLNNNRLKEIEIVFLKDSEDGSETMAKKSQIMQDCFNSWEDINLAMPIECDRINIFIRSVYPGEKYNDTCISEIRVN